MTLLHAFALGILQGFTEFLPISSSGHLVLAESVFSIRVAPKDMQGINILLHAGTLLALLMAYAETWISFIKERSHKLALLLVATIPGAVAGLLLEEAIALHFQNLLFVGIAFAVTGVTLLLGEQSARKKQSLWYRMLHPRGDAAGHAGHVSSQSAFFIGCAQAFALIPGLSRSGLTISAGRMMGLSRKESLDFSFLMAVPIIAGASAVAVSDLLSGQLTLPAPNIVAVSVATSFLSSFLAIAFLRKFVIQRSLAWFTPYLFVLSAITIFASLR